MRYDNCVSELIRKIPEYPQAEYEDDIELPYIVFGGFARFLQKLMDSKQIHKNVLERAFEFLNEMADSTDPTMENLLGVGVLEILRDNPGHIEIVMSYLNHKGRKCFQEMIDFWDGKQRGDTKLSPNP